MAVIDDSKATAVQAVKRALESLADRHVVLIVGGRDTGLDPSPIAATSAPSSGTARPGRACSPQSP